MRETTNTPRKPLWRHLVASGAILLVCALFFVWVGTMFVRDAASLSRREIVNDDYAVVTAPLETGGEVLQTITAEGRLYGVRVNIATFNRVVRGTLRLDVLDEAGARLTGTAVDMTDLLDNTFHHFLFDAMLDAGGGTAYQLRFTLEGETGDDVIGFHQSRGPAQDFVEPGAQQPHYPLAGFALSQNGEALEGTLALQYTVRYAGGFIINAFIFFASLLCLFFLALYWAVFAFKWPLHRLFALCAAVLGVVFMFLIPLRTAPDEYTHIATSYHYSNLLLGTAEGDSADTLNVRTGDAGYKLDNYDTTATGIFAYQDVAEGLFSKTQGSGMTEVPARVIRVFPLLYAAPTLGVVLARLLGLSGVGLMLLGRACNLALFCVCGSIAIKRMPFAKPVLFTVGLLPITLQQVASFNYDTWVLSIGFLLTAYCFAAMAGKGPIKPREWVPILVCSMLLAPAKAVYICMVALVLLVPYKRFGTKKRAWLARGAVFALALALWALFSVGDVAQQASGLAAPEVDDAVVTILDNGDAAEYYTLGYILRNIPATVKLLTLTLWQQGSLWLQGLVGGRLGEVIAINIETNWLWVLALVFILYLSCLPDAKEPFVPKPWQRLLTGGITLGVTALIVLACITWTPVNYDTVFGIQGRYFLPVLPLLLLTLRGRWLRLREPIWQKLAFITPVFVTLIATDGFIDIIARA